MNAGIGLALLVVEAALLSLAVLLPLLPALRGAAVRPRGSGAPALALHRAQRTALERDRADGLLEPGELDGARLEIDRRLLSAADAAAAEGASAPSGAAAPAPMRPIRVLLLLAPIPVLAGALYLLGGDPRLPAQPLSLRMAAGAARRQQDAALIAALRDSLARQDPASPSARQGFELLAQADAAGGDWAGAAAAWRTVLAQGFDPVIAVEAAEAQSRADGSVSPRSAALFRRALDAGSKDAPWRQLAEQRLAEFEHETSRH